MSHRRQGGARGEENMRVPNFWFAQTALYPHIEPPRATVEDPCTDCHKQAWDDAGDAHRIMKALAVICRPDVTMLVQEWEPLNRFQLKAPTVVDYLTGRHQMHLRLRYLLEEIVTAEARVRLCFSSEGCRRGLRLELSKLHTVDAVLLHGWRDDLLAPQLVLLNGRVTPPTAARLWDSPSAPSVAPPVEGCC